MVEIELISLVLHGCSSINNCVISFLTIEFVNNKYIFYVKIIKNKLEVTIKMNTGYNPNN